MAQSQVELCNRALSRIGVSQRIADIDSDNQLSRVCKTWYEQVRQDLLRGRPWPFAQRYVELGLIVEAPNIEWSYAYRYPPQYLKVYRLITEGTPFVPTIYSDLNLTYTPSFQQANPWQMGSDSQGRIIYTDLEGAIAVGTVDVTDEGLWDPQFADAFTWKLAAEIGAPLSKEAALVDKCYARAQYAEQVAAASAFNERTDRDPQDDSFTASRY